MLNELIENEHFGDFMADMEIYIDGLASIQIKSINSIAELGRNIPTAFNIFVRQSLREGGIPFDVSLKQPNKDCERPAVKGYTDLNQLFARRTH